ncbi:hypothetical protein N9I58_02150 [Candidatus Thioglobus sp.]|nr:hypothetical protein [Candidatus Thioglobus sp.]
MSIQRVLQGRKWFLFLEKIWFVWLFDIYSQFIQWIFRFFKSDSDIFYPYKTSYTHPYYCKQFYGKKSPFIWSNYKAAKILWFIQYPPKGLDLNNKSIIIEPNDHILTIATYFGASSPKECIEKIPKVAELISSDNIKAIFLADNEVRDQFISYFGYKNIDKVYMVPLMRCNPKLSLNDLNFVKNDKTVFICLISDYKIKALKLLLDAWSRLDRKSKLILVCHNLPKDIMSILGKDQSIKLIPKKRLRGALRDRLFKESSVSIALTHIDGGTNAFEGIDYGHAIITNDNHRASSLVSNDNGYIVPLKNKYYEEGRYGIEWDSFDEYLKIVEDDYLNGKYEESINILAKYMQELIDNPSILLSMRRNSIELANINSYENCNITIRNMIKNIYRQKI